MELPPGLATNFMFALSMALGGFFIPHRYLAPGQIHFQLTKVEDRFIFTSGRVAQGHSYPGQEFLHILVAAEVVRTGDVAVGEFIYQGQTWTALQDGIQVHLMKTLPR